MITYISGDILASNAECLVNTVNCEGFMGKGIAYQFKLRFPKNNEDYIKACKTNLLRIGTLHIFEEEGKIIINFPTKNKWREKSKMDYIHMGLEKLSEYLQKNNVSSIAIPPLGCGNGGLNWLEVKPVILHYLDSFKNSMDIQIFEPSTVIKKNTGKQPSKLKLAHIILMILKLNLLKPTKLNIQKAAYLFTILLKEDYFKFTKYKFDPYSRSIDTLFKEIKQIQDYYNFDTNQCLEYCKKQLISKNIQACLNKYNDTLLKAATFINNISDSKKIELVIGICYIVQESPKTNEEIYFEAKKLLRKISNDFSALDIDNMINILYKQNIIRKNLINQYELI